MGYGDADVYYQPEKFDLTPVAELDCPNCHTQTETHGGKNKHKPV